MDIFKKKLSKINKGHFRRAEYSAFENFPSDGEDNIFDSNRKNDCSDEESNTYLDENLNFDSTNPEKSVQTRNGNNIICRSQKSSNLLTNLAQKVIRKFVATRVTNIPSERCTIEVERNQHGEACTGAVGSSKSYGSCKSVNRKCPMEENISMDSQAVGSESASPNNSNTETSEGAVGFRSEYHNRVTLNALDRYNAMVRRVNEEKEQRDYRKLAKLHLDCEFIRNIYWSFDTPPVW